MSGSVDTISETISPITLKRYSSSVKCYASVKKTDYNAGEDTRIIMIIIMTT